jgi:hypothetical protein
LIASSRCFFAFTFSSAEQPSSQESIIWKHPKTKTINTYYLALCSSTLAPQLFFWSALGATRGLVPVGFSLPSIECTLRPRACSLPEGKLLHLLGLQTSWLVQEYIFKALFSARGVMAMSHSIVLTQASQYWSKSVQNSTLPGLRL